LTADGCVIEHYLAAGMAAQYHPLSAQFEHLPGTAPFDDVQERHD